MLILSVLYNEVLCSSLLSIAVINTMTKSSLGGKGLFHPKNQRPSLREARAGLPTEPWGDDEYPLVFPAVLGYLCCAAQAHLPRVT